MERREFSDETLMAYADGELDAETARQLEAAAQGDPEIARRIATFRETGDFLAGVGRARPLTPLSRDLEARVMETLRRGSGAVPASDTVIPFRQTRAPRAIFRPTAIAASLALAVGLAGGFLVAQAVGGRDEGGLRIASLDTPEISRALDTLRSGERVAVKGGEISTIASFLNAEGELCREFEFDRAIRDTVVSVACRSGAGWQARFAVVAAGADDTGYAPASSLDTLDAYLNAIGAGAPLSLEDEAAAMAAGAR